MISKSGLSKLAYALTVTGTIALFSAATLLNANNGRKVSQKKSQSPSVAVTVTVVSNQPLPETFSLSQNFPNPFNPETVIEYSLPVDTKVELTVYNILGNKVRTLVSQWQSAGLKSVRWNSKDDSGREVASGIYFYKLKTDKFENSRKMIVIK